MTPPAIAPVFGALFTDGFAAGVVLCPVLDVATHDVVTQDVHVCIL